MTINRTDSGMAKSSVPTNPREFLIKAKLYRAISMVFVILGLVVFMILYVANVEGRLMEALKNPFTLGMFVIPFLPAAVLSIIADRNEKKYIKLTGNHPS